MERKRMGRQTVELTARPRAVAWAAVGGKKEGEGPLGAQLDAVHADDTLGEDNWEKAESCLFEEAVRRCMEKSGRRAEEIDLLLGGDLLNQISASCFAARELALPFIGLFGACSTMAEGLALGGMLVDGGYAEHAICATGSHFCTAERQFRFPLELGTQRPPSAQRTVTGAGAVMLGCADRGPCFTHATIGVPIDLGVTDATNMGSAMAPDSANIDPLQ